MLATTVGLAAALHVAGQPVGLRSVRQRRLTDAAREKLERNGGQPWELVSQWTEQVSDYDYKGESHEDGGGGWIRTSVGEANGFTVRPL
jgi:hypothetical protein